MTGDIDSGQKDAHLGYSNGKLESLSNLNARFECGVLPWAAWESESSSFGRTFRKWACYPSFLPLNITSDHGVHWESKCWPNETESKFDTVFTWNRKKKKLMRTNHDKKSYHVPHPWVFYRSRYFPELPSKRLGTLVFYAHSNDTTTPVYENLDKYINELKSLPDKYQPIVICLMADDIKKGLHKDLRKYNLPLVTAGMIQSQKFVDRFYSLLYQFRYASSSNVGSHTFYILEAGVPFFLFGPRPEFQIKGSRYVKDGKQDLEDYGDIDDIRELAKLEKLLSSKEIHEVTPEQYAMASRYLGMDSSMSRLKASMILWRELFLHFDEVLKYIPVAFRRLISVTQKTVSTKTKS